MTTIGGMNDERSTPHDQQALKVGAHELQRAAGKVLTHASAAEDPRTLGVALAHIEEALDRLSVGMLQAANAVALGHGDSADVGHLEHLEPSAEALCFHLRLTADRKVMGAYVNHWFTNLVLALAVVCALFLSGKGLLDLLNGS